VVESRVDSKEIHGKDGAKSGPGSIEIDDEYPATLAMLGGRNKESGGVCWEITIVRNTHYARQMQIHL